MTVRSNSSPTRLPYINLAAAHVHTVRLDKLGFSFYDFSFSKPKIWKKEDVGFYVFKFLHFFLSTVQVFQVSLTKSAILSRYLQLMPQLDF